jgi:hypothetical protein
MAYDATTDVTLTHKVAIHKISSVEPHFDQSVYSCMAYPGSNTDDNYEVTEVALTSDNFG